MSKYHMTPSVHLLLALLLMIGSGTAYGADGWGPAVMRGNEPHRPVKTQTDATGLQFNGNQGPACEVAIPAGEPLPMGNWKMDLTLSRQTAKSRIWVELGAGAHPLYRLGLDTQPFLEQWSDGKWTRLWNPWRKPPVSTATFHLLQIGELQFLELGEKGSLVKVTQLPRATHARVVAAAPKGEALSARMTGWTSGPINKATPAASGTKATLHKAAYVNYLGWMPPDYRSVWYGEHGTDFPVLQLNDPRQREVSLMAKYGWTGAAVDFLFFEPRHVQSQVSLLRGFMDAVKEAGLKDFHVVPFLEVKDPQVTAAGVIYMLMRFRDRPEWGRQKGRPVIFMYNPMDSAFWKQVTDQVKNAGYHPFLIFNIGGLRNALTGDFDAKKFAPSIDRFDGVFSFNASSLMAAADNTVRMRKAYQAKHPNLAFGASIWPGYLSARPWARNFNSMMRTEFMRQVWAKVMAEKPRPDFLHWSTWNDFAEDTTLTQSYGILTSRLEISQRYLCDYFGRPLPQGTKDRPESVLTYRKCIYAGEPIKFEFLPLPTQVGPKRGKWHLKLLDEAWKTIAEVDSPEIALNAMHSWNWTLADGVQRSDTRVIRVRPTLIPDGAAPIHYANLPDIAVSTPVAYNDQLFYSVPLHRLAGADRGVKLLINGSATGAATAGLRRISYEVIGTDASKVEVASMRNAHMLRLLSPLNMRGAEMVSEKPNTGVDLLPLKKGESSDWISRQPSEGDGQDYFAALARFDDGTWAYSPTVWSRPSVDLARTAALWIFAPDQPNSREIIDRSGRHINLELPNDEKDKKTALKFIDLAGNGKALSFDGHSAIKAPLGVLPNGPITVELLFRPRQIGWEQVQYMQRGSQASLLIDAQGHLVARRLPELRVHPNPFVEIRTPQPLKAGRFYDVVVRYDGRKLALYLDGRMIGAKPCNGTRSTEGFLIGGPMSTDEVGKMVDGLPPRSFFEGDMVRLALYGGAVDETTIARWAEDARQLPFWK